MAIFDRLDRMVSTTCDRHFAMRAKVFPYVSTPNGRSKLDPYRPCLSLRGIFDVTPAMHDVEIGERNRGSNNLRTISAGAGYTYSFDQKRDRFANQIRQGDILVLEEGDRHFEVVSVERDGSVRAMLRLVEAEARYASY